ncbi:sialidase-1 [Pontibacter ummariensis]|uniref:exo-alpha-sialidase n=1 Tax=Pontibacter ummariensis TaxID=1610492 RepID=A0A239L4N9_9BACT|nr:sialidase family protein [Pontibacter ummariensis]PRY04312.1 sialidase-1 [Pontibacter ummariensis]SNT24962.1 sialidase-1 [Pontibacter ummariensis]
MLRLLFTLAFLSTTLLAQAQVNNVPVFISGQEGHKSYRIPAVIGLPNGDILAFAEGRVHGAADFGDVNIVMKRSSDKGKTWSALQTVIDYDTLQAGNAAPVVDMTDPAYPKGRIFLFYNTGNAHEHEVRSGKGFREVWYVTSTDEGQTWSEPVNITTQVHRPNMPSANPAYTYKEDWRAYANTPGHAIQFSDGKYRGRIFVAANHSQGKPKSSAEDYYAHGFYTDDHGKTFKISQTVPESGGNEAMAAELTNNRLMMNIRNQQGDVRARIVSISSDGGTTWDTTYFDRQLPDPVNQGSLLRLGKKRGKAILAFSNAADPQRRDNLTLRISYDEGKTWPEQYTIAKSKNGEKDHAAYSDLVKVGKKEVGVLYEKDGYQKIVFTVVERKK